MDSTPAYDGNVNPVVFAEIDPGSTCLDIGCWRGALGKRLMEEKRCVVDGVDHRPDVLESARAAGYRNTYCVDLNQAPLDIAGRYDVVILADVIEHLVRPVDVLARVGDLLAPGGLIILSVPNIAFIQQRVRLLLGRFDYDPRGGIMDATHLRFFTRKTILETVREAGLSCVSCVGYAHVRPRFFFLRPLTKCWPELWALQFLLKVRKTPTPS